MSPWAWILLLLGALLGVVSLCTVFEFEHPVAVPLAFAGSCGLVYMGEMWETWRPARERFLRELGL